MSGRVYCRLGSIFDEECDLLVIPSSAGGTVTPGVQQEMRKAGIPFPGAMPWGSLTLSEFTGPRFKRVAYAATVSGQGSTPEIVEKIGAHLGTLAATMVKQRTSRAHLKSLLSGVRTEAAGDAEALPFDLMFSAPLLGAGAGDLEPTEAATALRAGFLAAAPSNAHLVISIRDKDDYREVLETLQSSKHAPQRDPAAAAAPLSAATEGWIARREREAAVEGPPGASAAAAGKLSARKGVFISYSHADAEWLERLQKHLRPLQRDGVDVWDDTRLKAGEQWREEIRQALVQTKVAVLLISADFLASDFIVTDELPPLLKAAEEDGATILPVIISASRFDRTESLSRFQAVNTPSKPLVKMRRANQEEVLDKVARAVEDALKR